MLTAYTHAVDNLSEAPHEDLQQAIESLKYTLKLIVQTVQMTPMCEPQIFYCDTEGNEGLTGFIVIETSHISFHWWSTTGLLQFDVYSCADFDTQLVEDTLRAQFSDKYLDVIATHIIDRNPTR